MGAGSGGAGDPMTNTQIIGRLIEVMQKVPESGPAGLLELMAQLSNETPSFRPPTRSSRFEPRPEEFGIAPDGVRTRVGGIMSWGHLTSAIQRLSEWHTNLELSRVMSIPHVRASDTLRFFRARGLVESKKDKRTGKLGTSYMAVPGAEDKLKSMRP